MHMRMAKYVAKRILLMIFVLFVITTICFMLIRMLPRELPMDKNQAEIIKARWEALGYYEPLPVQYGIYLKNIFTELDFGTSWGIQYHEPALNLITGRLLPTVMVNFYSLILSIPVGIMLGIYAAIKKNKWQDSLISTSVMVFVSVPSYVYAFLVQYIFYFKLRWFPLTVSSLADAGGSWFTWKMFYSMILPVLSLSFGSIAGLTRAQATSRHAFKNAMVPILPMILSSFVGVLGGSFVIEQIFAIPGVGQLYLQSISLFDYDVFMVDCVFYVFIGLLAGIVVDLSYGFIDPRIRMGEK